VRRPAAHRRALVTQRDPRTRAGFTDRTAS
jgi:hypothetical protein